jgi:hypothetical protein
LRAADSKEFGRCCHRGFPEPLDAKPLADEIPIAAGAPDRATTPPAHVELARREAVQHADKVFDPFD